MFGRIGLPELILIFLVILLLFGVKSLPEIARGLARGIKAFKKEARDLSDDFDRATDPAPVKSEDKSNDTANDFDPNTERRDWRPTSKSGKSSDNS